MKTKRQLNNLRFLHPKDDKKVLFQRLFNKLYAFVVYKGDVYWNSVTHQTLRFLRKREEIKQKKAA